MKQAKTTENDEGAATKPRRSNTGEAVGRRIVFIRDGQVVRTRRQRPRVRG